MGEHAPWLRPRPRPLHYDHPFRGSPRKRGGEPLNPTMEHTQRPPRSVPPPSAQQHLQHQSGVRSPLSGAAGVHNVSFALNEAGDRAGPLPSGRQQRYSASIDPNALAAAEQSDPEAVGAKMARKRSLVRPERERIDPSHRQWHYRTHAAQMEEQGGSRMIVHPSSRPIHISFTCYK